MIDYSTFLSSVSKIEIPASLSVNNLLNLKTFHLASGLKTRYFSSSLVPTTFINYHPWWWLIIQIYVQTIRRKQYFKEIIFKVFWFVKKYSQIVNRRQDFLVKNRLRTGSIMFINNSATEPMLATNHSKFEQSKADSKITPVFISRLALRIQKKFKLIFNGKSRKST